ncbi:MAG: hypothetical protein IJK66_04930 [Bacilli bacterium]|nr:hypothetical protein [Bacilli bacterium]
MIVRKPYAFLIKYFKAIHLFMLALSVYVFYHTKIALEFFNDYVRTRQFIESETLINDTIPLSMAIFAFLLIAITVMILILFRKKDKPIVFYLSSVIFYFIFILFVLVSRGIMPTIIFEGIDPRISRIIRDIWLISYYLQIVLLVFYFIRAIGFDVKKFNFGEDLHELRIEDEDSEEIELATKFDRDKFRIKVAMEKEELKSFYYENKFIIIIIFILTVVVIPGVFIIKDIAANKRYSENEVINLNKFEFKVTNTYITKKDSKGNTLFKGNTSYLIVKFNINNLTNNKRGIKLNNLRLEINDNVYIPKTIYYDYFSDIGTGYTDQTISKESKDFIAVYVLPDSELSNNIILRYTDSLKVKNNEATALYYRIIIKPNNIDESIRKVNYKLGDELSIKNSNIKFKIDNSKIKEEFTYEENYKTKYIVYVTGIVLSLECDSKVNLMNALTKYGSIQYKIGDSTYTESINNVTPNNYKESILYLGVNEDMKNADSIDLVLKSRDIEYIYKVK